MVKTRHEKPNDQDREPHYCFFCEEQTLAAYWTQNEFPDGESQHPVIWHCQSHRWHARKLAEHTIPSKICKFNSFEYRHDFTAHAFVAPIKTRPITGLNVTTKAGVYLVEFFRDNALRSYRITTWKRIIALDSLLKKCCEVAEVNLFSCGQVSIWYNMK